MSTFAVIPGASWPAVWLSLLPDPHPAGTLRQADRTFVQIGRRRTCAAAGRCQPLKRHFLLGNYRLRASVVFLWLIVAVAAVAILSLLLLLVVVEAVAVVVIVNLLMWILCRVLSRVICYLGIPGAYPGISLPVADECWNLDPSKPDSLSQGKPFSACRLLAFSLTYLNDIQLESFHVRFSIEGSSSKSWGKKTFGRHNVAKHGKTM